MITIQVAVNAESSKAQCVLDTVTKVCVEASDVPVQLGRILYAVEEMGYPFVTDSVYSEAIDVYNRTTFGSRNTTVYNKDGIKIMMHSN